MIDNSDSLLIVSIISLSMIGLFFKLLVIYPKENKSHWGINNTFLREFVYIEKNYKVIERTTTTTKNTLDDAQPFYQTVAHNSNISQQKSLHSSRTASLCDCLLHLPRFLLWKRIKKEPCDYHSQKKDNWSKELGRVVCWLRLLLQVVVGTFLSALCRLLCLPSEIDLLRILHGTVRQNKNLSGQLLENCRQYPQWLQFAVSTVMPCNWTRWTFGLILI